MSLITVGLGRLTRDPVTRKTQKGEDVCNFCIAVDDGFGDKKQTDYINCTAWKHSAKYVGNYVRKGDQVHIVGKIKNKVYDAKDGTKRTEIYINVTDVTKTSGEKVTKKSTDQQTSNTHNQDADEETDTLNIDSDDLSEIDDDTLPF